MMKPRSIESNVETVVRLMKRVETQMNALEANRQEAYTTGTYEDVVRVAEKLLITTKEIYSESIRINEHLKKRKQERSAENGFPQTSDAAERNDKL